MEQVSIQRQSREEWNETDPKRIKDEDLDKSIFDFTIPVVPIPLVEPNTSIRSTHDHKWLKACIPHSLRHRRKLAKIEAGIDKGVSLGAMPAEFLASPKGGDDWYGISSYPWLHIRGDPELCNELSRRVYRLSQNVLLGQKFLSELQDLGERVELEIIKSEGLVQVVVRALFRQNRGLQENQFDDNFMPLEWCSHQTRVAMNQILIEIQTGNGNYIINRNHPNKDEIIACFTKLTMRPPGIRLLTEIARLVKTRIKIKYGKTNTETYYIRKTKPQFSVEINTKVNPNEIGVSKDTNTMVAIQSDAVIALAHELIHVVIDSQILRQERSNHRRAVDLDRLILEQNGYKADVAEEAYPLHTNLDEQYAILGSRLRGYSDPSENTIRYSFCMNLRFGHTVWDPSFKDTSIDEIRPIHPCFMGKFPNDQFHLAILKCHKKAAKRFAQAMAYEEIHNSLEKLSTFKGNLTKKQRQFCYKILNHLLRHNFFPGLESEDCFRSLV